jgi:hypothetical protein
MNYPNKALRFLLLSTAVLLFAYCSNSPKNNTQITNDTKTRTIRYEASISVIRSDTVISCDYNQVTKNVLNVKLSSFIDSCKITRLETSENAFVKFTSTYISDNLIGIRNNGRIPFKLFDYSGKFLGDIGKIGRGPNEYTNLYSEIIDEQQNCIYLLPWSRRQILRYDLKGIPIEPISLKYDIIKANIFINQDTITVLNLPFSADMKIAYVQTFSGKIISELPAKRHAFKPDFSNEIFSSKNDENFDLHLSKFFGVVNDTLYHYQNNRLKPVFTVFFDSKEIPIHNYFELPDYFVCQIMSTSKGRGNSTTATSHEIIMIDKKTLEAKRIRLINDYFGNIEMDFNFKNGKFINNLYTNELADRISKALEEDNLSEESRNQLLSFRKSFNLDDNNIVFFGNLK